jgi:transcriptional regulator with XRE-family HTH domain
MASLGKTLTGARERKGLSLREAERGTGISNAYLSQIENGKIASPSPNVLHKLAEFYSLSYAALMREAGYPSSESGATGGDGIRIAARLGPTSPEEEEALAEYLEFMRSRTTRQR